MGSLNTLRWDGSPGHYEVHYLTTTDPLTRTGVWLRFTMLAPLTGEPTCSLWLVATTADGPPVARKATWPIERLEAAGDPFALRIAGAELTDVGSRGDFEDVAWDLGWAPGRPYEHVRPLLRRAGVAATVLVLPHGDLAVSGTVTLPGQELSLDAAHGAQAHLWGTKHSTRWTWAHCGDFVGADGAPHPGTFVDGVSAVARRLGREVGPATPVVGRLLDDDFAATGPLAVLRANSRFGLTSWAFDARAGRRRAVVQVDAPRTSLAGVVYTDPDGERAHCYNSEVASMRVAVLDRSGSGWIVRERLSSDGRAHFEYGQRAPVPDMPLHLA